MRVFGSKLFGGKPVYDRWVTDNRHNFKLFLNEFNIRKHLLDIGDIEGLFKRISREAYDRFYSKAKLVIDSYLSVDGEVDQSILLRLYSDKDRGFLKQYFKI